MAAHMGVHHIDILGEGGNGLCKGTIFCALGVMAAPVLTLLLMVATTSAMPATSTMVSSTQFAVSRSAALADTALMGRQ